MMFVIFCSRKIIFAITFFGGRGLIFYFSDVEILFLAPFNIIHLKFLLYIHLMQNFETDKNTYKQTDSDIKTDKDRHWDKQKLTQTHRLRERERDKNTYKHTGTKSVSVFFYLVFFYLNDIKILFSVPFNIIYLKFRFIFT